MSSENMKAKEADIAMVRKSLDGLIEHFDTVHIFVTRHTPDGTVRISSGAGNWYARYGQIREWMLVQDEECRCLARTDDPDPASD